MDSNNDKKPKKKSNQVSCVGCMKKFTEGRGVQGRAGNAMCMISGEFCSSECLLSSIENGNDF